MEYEYSFNVSDISEYIKYCEENGYKLLSNTKQTRIVYKNSNGSIARITIEDGDIKVNKLDFKEDKLVGDDLNIRRETKPIEFDSFEACEDILQFLNYNKAVTLIRQRYTYNKNGVTFEIDVYTEPEALVVAIEGIKEEVDNVYKRLQPLNRKYKLK